MTKQAIISKTIEIINKLPEDKAEEISDFADFIIRKYEEENLVSEGKAFEFLAEEDELYSVKDLKEKF